MVATAFKQAWKAAAIRYDKLIVLFGAAAFVVYTITGRFTQVDAMLFIFLVLMLPLCAEDVASEKA